MVNSLFGMRPGSLLAGASEFFIYDIIKIFFPLSVIIFIVSVIRSDFPPERTKRILSHKKEFIGNSLAAFMGIVNGKTKHPRKPLPSPDGVKELINAKT